MNHKNSSDTERFDSRNSELRLSDFQHGQNASIRGIAVYRQSYKGDRQSALIRFILTDWPTERTLRATTQIAFPTQLTSVYAFGCTSVFCAFSKHNHSYQQSIRSRKNNPTGFRLAEPVHAQGIGPCRLTFVG